MRKRGSLSLSVNAIVILVLGITMLGLGLAFTKGMFGKLGSKLEIPPPNIPATEDEPIVLPSDEVKVDPKGVTIIPINVYNDGDTGTIGLEFYTPNMPKCTYTDHQPDGPQISASGQKIPSDEYRTFQVIVEPGAMDIEGTCIVTILSQEEVSPTEIRKIASKQIKLVPD